MNSNQHQDDSDQFSLIGMLMTPFSAVKEVFDEYGKSGRRSDYDDKSMAEKIMGFVTLPFRLLAGFFMFLISSWSTSRNGYSFLKALPVLLVFGGFAALLLLADLINTEGKRLGHNLGHLRFHATESPEFCEMFARNLMNLKAEPEFLYELGVSYGRNEQNTEAYDVMRSLAPDNMLVLHAEEMAGKTGGELEITPGFSNAHIWLSQYYGKTRTLDITDQLRDSLVEEHLAYAVRAEPENRLARYNLALLFLKEADKHEDKKSPEYLELISKAVKELENVVSGDDFTRYQLAAMPKLIELKIELADDDIQLQKRLAQYINFLKPKSERFPDEVAILSTMVRCAILMEDYPRAIAIVRNGLQLAQDPSSRMQIHRMASMVLLERATKYKDLTNPIDYRGRVHTLAEAVYSNPSERAVYTKLLDFVGTVPSEPGIFNDQWLSDSINGTEHPGIIHCLLGFKKVSEGDFLVGEKHWRIAERQYPNARGVINNLMDVATVERPDEFKNLLDMITLGVELFRDQPIFRRTRGVYLANLGRHEEAIADLVYAAEKIPRVIDVHQHLILCYEKTGDSAKEDEQRQILENKLGLLEEEQRKRLEAAIGTITHE